MTRPLYQNLTSLRDGQVIEVEGLQLKMVEGKVTGRDLDAGDTYYACRNTEQVLTVKSVDLENGWVVAEELAYSFNLNECVGVELV